MSGSREDVERSLNREWCTLLQCERPTSGISVESLLNSWDAYCEKLKEIAQRIAGIEEQEPQQNYTLERALAFFGVSKVSELPRAADLRKYDALEVYISDISGGFNRAAKKEFVDAVYNNYGARIREEIREEIARSACVVTDKTIVTDKTLEEEFSADPFYKAIAEFKALLDREMTGNILRFNQYNDYVYMQRNEALQMIVSSCDNIIKTAKNIARDERKEIVFDEFYKSSCKRMLINHIDQSLIKNKAINQHRNWGTRFGKTLLNILKGLLCVIPPVGIYAYNKGSAFFSSTSTQARKKADNILEESRKIGLGQ